MLWTKCNLMLNRPESTLNWEGYNGLGCDGDQCEGLIWISI